MKKIDSLNLKISCMKKLNTYLHNPEIQGSILIALIFVAIAVTTVLTWGK